MTPTKLSFSPRELAAALGVSESSMKRWIDAGEVEAVRTAGGHRRVAQAEAIRFIRGRRLHVVDPSALGLQALEQDGLNGSELTAEALVEAFLSQDAARAERLIIAAYLRGSALQDLFDGPVRQAMDRLGELWRGGSGGIMFEHRATDVLVRTLSRIRSLQPPAHPRSPVAVGGAIAGDPYLLPSMMAAAVLAESGFAVTNLGADTPLEAIVEACRRLNGDMIWLSVSVPIEEDHLVDQLRAVTAQTAPRPLALGGRGLRPLDLPEIETVHLLPSMTALAELGASLATSFEG